MVPLRMRQIKTVSVQQGQGFVMWFTGLPCSGKSTLAKLISRKLELLKVKVQVLDGDVIRAKLTSDLGYSEFDRNENIRRIGYVAELLSANGINTIVATISPYSDARANLRKEIPNFIETYLECDIAICAKRDVKGLYKKAFAGEITNFTGVSDRYEPPNNPELILQTGIESEDQSVVKVLDFLSDHGYC